MLRRGQSSLRQAAFALTNLAPPTRGDQCCLPFILLLHDERCGVARLGADARDIRQRYRDVTRLPIGRSSRRRSVLLWCARGAPMIELCEILGDEVDQAAW